VAKFVEMIGNQVRQLQELQEQVSTLHHYVELFGDPASVIPASVEALGADLVKAELGAGLQEIMEAPIGRP
jgi:hypothetical protein